MRLGRVTLAQAGKVLGLGVVVVGIRSYGDDGGFFTECVWI